ncbi:helix-turn-helix transcriptional regulator [Comamonas humi]
MPTSIQPPDLPPDVRIALDRALVRLYAADLDLHALPPAIFACVDALIGCEQVSYGEYHGASGDFRSLFLHNPPQENGQRTASLDAYQRHAVSHPFWLKDPSFFGERALRDSDFFTDEEFMALPIAREVFLPFHAHHAMAVVVSLHGYALSMTCHRVLGQPAFSDMERDLLQELRGHMARLYRHALERTQASLSPQERIAYLCPDLTPRQRQVALLLAEAKSNEAIAQALYISIETVKTHVRMLYEKLAVEDRLAAALAITSRPLFAQMPPLWRLPGAHWGPAGEQVNKP